MKRTSSDYMECPACASEDLTYWEELDSSICDSCSYVLESDIDISTIEARGNNSGVSPNSVTADGTEWKDNIAAKDKSEANLVDVLTKSEEAGECLDLSYDQEIRTAEVLTEAWKTNFMHGRNKIDTIAASLYVVSREEGNTIPPGMIARTVGTDKQSVKNMYKQLVDHLGIDLDPPIPEDYVPSVCSELGLSQDIQDAAIDLLSKQRPRGGNPVGIAAAGVYLVCDSNQTDLTLRDVGAVVNMTKETVWRQKSKITDN